jgi:hypothetical protein
MRDQFVDGLIGEGYARRLDMPLNRCAWFEFSHLRLICV